MSSGEDDYNHDYNDLENSTTVPDSKKRRVQRACDTCRRKKSQSLSPSAFDNDRKSLIRWFFEFILP